MIPTLVRMPEPHFSTPILLLVFNRPDYLARQIEILRELRPTQLYVSGDGPRSTHPTDSTACQEIKKTLKLIDWNCEVVTKLRSKNLGCKVGVSSGIDWFFEHVIEGIILEDDCLPDLSFFEFSEQLLKKYRHDERVGQIGGTNLFENVISPTSYYFSIHPACWGWATWRRAWQKYDVTMQTWPEDGQAVLQRIFSSRSAVSYWTRIFQKTWHSEIDTWDYQWIYTCWKYDMWSAIPTQNLVENIGFDARATHTRHAFSPLAHLQSGTMVFPLKHPSVQTNDQLDQQAQITFFEKHSYLKFLGGLQRFIQRTLSRMLE
jgi:hypothetical protein